MIDTIFKLSMLTIECQNVIVMRMLKLAYGGAGAATEAQLMCSEKAEAAFEAGVALAAGGTIGETIDSYRRIVQANQKRLRRRTSRR